MRIQSPARSGSAPGSAKVSPLVSSSFFQMRKSSFALNDSTGDFRSPSGGVPSRLGFGGLTVPFRSPDLSFSSDEGLPESEVSNGSSTRYPTIPRRTTAAAAATQRHGGLRRDSPG